MASNQGRIHQHYLRARGSPLSLFLCALKESHNWDPADNTKPDVSSTTQQAHPIASLKTQNAGITTTHRRNSEVCHSIHRHLASATPSAPRALWNQEWRWVVWLRTKSRITLMPRPWANGEMQPNHRVPKKYPWSWGSSSRRPPAASYRWGLAK